MGGGLIHQTVLNRIVDQFGAIFHVHLLQNAGAVGTHRLDAQSQPVGNLGDRLAAADQAQDLIFAVRQGFMGQFVCVLIQGKGNLLGQGRVDVLAAAVYLMDGLDQFIVGACSWSGSRTPRLSIFSGRTGIPDGWSG